MIVITITRTFSLEHSQVYVGWKELLWNSVYNKFKFVRHFTLRLLLHINDLVGILHIILSSRNAIQENTPLAWSRTGSKCTLCNWLRSETNRKTRISIRHVGIYVHVQSSIDRTAVPFSPQQSTTIVALAKATKHKANPATDEVRVENRNHGLAWSQTVAITKQFKDC